MNKVIFGDCRSSMRQLIADGVKVQMCVTSPPYWGLRDYGVAGQLGLEPTIAEYVANMVEVFGLVRELLRDDGVLWLNIGDSYSNAGTRQGDRDGSVSNGINSHRAFYRATAPGLKNKDLCGIPWRVAFALQAAGWYLRQDIIWAKPNPMPESVTDRCTKSHEYLFLLAKSERYYMDMAAIREPNTPGTLERLNSGPVMAIGRQPKKLSIGEKQGMQDYREALGRNKRSVWTIATQSYSEAHFATFPPALIEPCIMAGSRPGDVVFDPFMGSGTTGQVAQALGRQWLGCELNEDYGALQDMRTAQMGMVL